MVYQVSQSNEELFAPLPIDLDKKIDLPNETTLEEDFFCLLKTYLNKDAGPENVCNEISDWIKILNSLKESKEVLIIEENKNSLLHLIQNETYMCAKCGLLEVWLDSPYGDPVFALHTILHALKKGNSTDLLLLLRTLHRLYIIWLNSIKMAETSLHCDLLSALFTIGGQSNETETLAFILPIVYLILQLVPRNSPELISSLEYFIGHIQWVYKLELKSLNEVDNENLSRLVRLLN